MHLIKGLLHPSLSQLLNEVEGLLRLGKSFQATHGDLVVFLSCWHFKELQSNFIDLDVLAHDVSCDGHGYILINTKERTSET